MSEQEYQSEPQVAEAPPQQVDQSIGFEAVMAYPLQRSAARKVSVYATMPEQNTVVFELYPGKSVAAETILEALVEELNTRDRYKGIQADFIRLSVSGHTLPLGGTCDVEPEMTFNVSMGMHRKALVIGDKTKAQKKKEEELSSQEQTDLKLVARTLGMDEVILYCYCQDLEFNVKKMYAQNSLGGILEAIKSEKAVSLMLIDMAYCQGNDQFQVVEYLKKELGQQVTDEGTSAGTHITQSFKIGSVSIKYVGAAMNEKTLAFIEKRKNVRMYTKPSLLGDGIAVEDFQG